MLALADVLPACAWAAQHSSLVTIDHTAVERFAPTLAKALPTRMRHTEHHLLGRGEETIAYFVVLDTLNFGSGFFDHLRPYRGHSNYFAIAAALRDWIARDGAPNAKTLQAMDAAAMCALLEQDHGNPALTQLFAWQARALHELGAFLEGALAHRYSNVLAHRGAHAIVALLCQMPMFRDAATLDGHAIPLLKRAQILVHDLAIAAEQDSGLPLEQLEDLTVFADNMLPFALHAEGVLAYDPALSARLANGALQPSERADVELRANSIWACALLRQQLQRNGIETTAREIDFALWNAGTALEQRGGRKPHVCQTYFY
jgi:hypothetical protein